METEIGRFPRLPDLARALHGTYGDLGLTHVLNGIAGAPEIPAPGLHYFFNPHFSFYPDQAACG
jgi:hypothetical protein